MCEQSRRALIKVFFTHSFNVNIPYIEIEFHRTIILRPSIPNFIASPHPYFVHSFRSPPSSYCTVLFQLIITHARVHAP